MTDKQIDEVVAEIKDTYYKMDKYITNCYWDIDDIIDNKEDADCITDRADEAHEYLNNIADELENLMSSANQLIEYIQQMEDSDEN